MKAKITFWDLLVLGLSTYVLLALLLDTFFELSAETSDLIQKQDFLICALFLVEFIVRFMRAENKLKFMRWGWVDLLASVPAVDILRAGRLLRIIRLLRVYRSASMLFRYFLTDKVKGTATGALILSFLVSLTASVAILQVEVDPESNIKTAEDALWWTYVTITTVGYGDKYPVTTEGRLIAVGLMTCGVGLFGVMTALLASRFVRTETQETGESTGLEQD